MMILFSPETRRGLVQGNASTSREDEENVALTAKGKKKFKKGPKKGGVLSTILYNS